MFSFCQQTLLSRFGTRIDDVLTQYLNFVHFESIKLLSLPLYGAKVDKSPQTLLPSAGKLENCSTGVMVKDVSKGQEAPQQQQLPEQ